MSEHAKLSPSHATTWMTCAGALVLSEGMPQKSSKFAEEGTVAHSLAESILTGKDEPEVTDAMHDAVTIYTEHVFDLFKAPSAVLHVEEKVSVTEHCWGTMDAGVWRPDLATLFVRDLKYGAGVAVDVNDNLQLEIYALAALKTLKYPAETVNVGIVQPRMNHSDGPVRTVEFDSVDLMDFHADLTDAAFRVKEAFAAHGTLPNAKWNEQFLVPSEKGCRWCLAAPKCPVLRSKAQTIAKQVFTPQAPYDAKELATTLDFLPILEGWIKNTREFAYSEAEQGRVPPTYKLVEKQANRKWKPGIAEALAEALKVPKAELFGEAPMKGVTDLQKLATGKNDKERAAVLEPFVVKESSGHTLVHESDKREPVRIDAKTVFA